MNIKYYKIIKNKENRDMILFLKIVYKQMKTYQAYQCKFQAHFF